MKVSLVTNAITQRSHSASSHCMSQARSMTMTSTRRWASPSIRSRSAVDKCFLSASRSTRNNLQSHGLIPFHDQWMIPAMTMGSIRYYSDLIASTTTDTDSNHDLDQSTPPADLTKLPDDDVIDAYCKRNKEEYPLTCYEYQAVLKAYKRTSTLGDVYGMLTVYDEMVEKQVVPTSYSFSDLLQALAEHQLNRMQKIASTERFNKAMGGHSEQDTDEIVVDFTQRIRDIFDAALENKKTHSFNLTLYNRILLIYATNGDLANALHIYEKIEQSLTRLRPDSVSFANLIVLFGTVRDETAITECFQEYQTVKSYLGKHNAALVYNEVVKAYAKVGNLDKAIEVAKSMVNIVDQKVSATAYGVIIEMAAEKGDIEWATQLVEQLKDDPLLPDPSSYLYGQLLTAYTKQQDIEKATQVYNKIQEIGLEHVYIPLSGYLRLCAEKNLPDDAMKVAKKMGKAGLALEVSLCKAIVSSYHQTVGESAAHRALLDLCRQESKKVKMSDAVPLVRYVHDTIIGGDDLPSLIPLYSLLSIFKAHMPVRVSQRLMSLYEETRADDEKWAALKQSLDENSYKTLFVACLGGYYDVDIFEKLSEHLYEDMTQLGIPLDTTMSLRVATRLRKAGAWDKAERWNNFVVPSTQISNKKSDRVHDEVERLSAKALESVFRDEPEMAIQILKEDIIKAGNLPNPAIVIDLVRNLSRRKRADLCQQLYDIMLPHFQELHNNQSRGVMLSLLKSAMIESYSIAKNSEACKDMYRQMLQLGMFPTPNDYSHYIMQLSDEEIQQKGARYFYNALFKRRLRPSVFFFNVMLSRMSQLNNIEMVDHLLQVMRKNKVHPNPVTFGTAVAAYARSDREKDMVAMFNKMRSYPAAKHRVNFYNSVIAYYAYHQKNVDKVKEYVQIMLDTGFKPDDYLYQAVYEGFHGKDETYDAGKAREFLDGLMTPTSSHT